MINYDEEMKVVNTFGASLNTHGKKVDLRIIEIKKDNEEKKGKKGNIICNKRCFPLFIDLTLSDFGHLKISYKMNSSSLRN
jgi:hypothetical protein